ncbi:MrcB family domain-containing protein [Lysinibacillus xylanilyticus]|uniref:Type IV methyl-directed restriction enzyme EcoKMcrB subunit DNA-binding domain-containing protein n=1 Tax=Lysinibacillus xylanilyticus TaxID=582475 RepID=A0A2M9Q5M3_9BACI|nr:hypothetical protein CWD94_12540 [Lysinibacillus xylanilyticus]
MSISNTLQKIMRGKQSGVSVDELVTETLVKELEALPVVMADENLHIYGRTATGGQSFVPWVGIMNKKLTTTVKQSIYLVFLFAQNDSSTHSSPSYSAILQTSSGICLYKQLSSATKISYEWLSCLNEPPKSAISTIPTSSLPLNVNRTFSPKLNFIGGKFQFFDIESLLLIF